MLDQAFFDTFKTYDWGVDPNAIKPLNDAVISSHGDVAARKDLEDRLIAVLKTEIPRAAKDAVCRALRTAGTAASVPALAALLPSEELSHMARYALELNPAPEAGKVLLEALPRLSGKLKLGIISSLGARREAAAIAPLQALLAGNDPEAAHAAAHALGTIGSIAAAKILVTAKPAPATKEAIADASMECAEELLASGNKVAAKATYEKLLANKPSKPVQIAATRGLKTVAGG
jgi:HEAT repeat protein